MAASATANEVDTGDAVSGAVTVEVDGASGVTDGVSTTTWLAATATSVSVLTAATEDDVDEVAAVDEDVLAFPVPCRVVASLSVVSVPAEVTVDEPEVPVDDDWSAVAPVVPETGEFVCDPLVLPALASEVDCFVVEVLLDVDPEEISPPDDAAPEVDVGSEVADPPLAVLLPAEAEVDDESDPDDEDPSDVVSAHATPCPLKTAAPTPRATASPPTRPIYREALIASPLPAGGSSTRETVTRRMAVATAVPTGWEVLHQRPVKGGLRRDRRTSKPKGLAHMADSAEHAPARQP